MKEITHKLNAVLFALNELKSAFSESGVEPTVWFVGHNRTEKMPYFLGQRIAAIGDGKIDFNQTMLLDLPITDEDVDKILEIFNDSPQIGQKT